MRTLLRKLRSFYRELRFVVGGIASTSHPLVAHLIVTRRCNLGCTYCNEKDDFSDPVVTSELLRRIDLLADLRTAIIVFTGGEPLLHPDISQLVRAARRRGIMTALISNCAFMTREKIAELNAAGLEYLQVSLDNVEPDAVSEKSLSLLEPTLELLARHADFRVHVNSVIGGGVESPEDALVIAQRASSLGFTSSVGIIHNGRGTLKPLGSREQAVYAAAESIRRKGYTRFSAFQENLAAGRPNVWRCRAGARYLYVCEDGLVHYCSQQRGHPGVVLERYSREDIHREYLTPKACAPFCTLSCSHHVSVIDSWRDPQERTPYHGRVPKNTAGLTIIQ